MKRLSLPPLPGVWVSRARKSNAAVSVNHHYYHQRTPFAPHPYPPEITSKQLQLPRLNWRPSRMLIFMRTLPTSTPCGRSRTLSQLRPALARLTRKPLSMSISKRTLHTSTPSGTSSALCHLRRPHYSSSSNRRTSLGGTIRGGARVHALDPGG